MASDVFANQIVIPALTVPTAPYMQDISFAPMLVEQIHWRVPPGHVGLTGWRLTSGGAQVIPKNLGAWVIADGENGTWELSDLHDSGKWELTGYNLGNQPHAVYIRFNVAPIHSRHEARAVLAAAELAPVPDLARAGRPLARRP